MNQREIIVPVELRCCGFKTEQNMPVVVHVHTIVADGEILEAWCEPKFSDLTPYIKREEVRANLPLECLGK